MGLAHGGQQGTGLWAVGRIQGGPRPLLFLRLTVDYAHGMVPQWGAYTVRLAGVKASRCSAAARQGLYGLLGLLYIQAGMVGLQRWRLGLQRGR